MTSVAERGRPQLYFDTNFVTVSQKLAELYSSAYFDALLFAVQIPPNHVFIMRVYTIIIIVLYLRSVTALQKDEGCFPSATIF